MNTETTTPTAPKATLSQATTTLFLIAARSHTLADMFGIEQTDFCVCGDCPDCKSGKSPLTFLDVPRPFLTKHPKANSTDLLMTFDPDRFAKRLNHCSDGTRHMMLFILSVWNPHYAQSKRWKFDLFDALGTLDEQNRQAIAWWLQHPIWP